MRQTSTGERAWWRARAASQAGQAGQAGQVGESRERIRRTHGSGDARDGDIKDTQNPKLH